MKRIIFKDYESYIYNLIKKLYSLNFIIYFKISIKKIYLIFINKNIE